MTHSVFMLNDDNGGMRYVITLALLVISQPAIAQWSVDISQDAMTDASINTAYADSSNAVFGSKKATLGAVKRCPDGLFLVSLFHPWVFDINKPLTYRFDKEEPEKYPRWFTENRKVMQIGRLGDKKDAAAFAEKMVTAKSLVLRYHEVGGSTVDAKFDLTGFAKEYEKIKKACD